MSISKLDWFVLLVHMQGSLRCKQGEKTSFYNFLWYISVYWKFILFRPVGRGGSRGFARTPLFTSKRFYMHRLTVHFKCPTVWKWSTSLAAIENHRCPNESDYSYASFFVEDQRGTGGCLRHCDERTRVNTCVNKSLVLALQSCLSSDVTPPAVLLTLVPSLVEFQNQLV